MKIKEKNTKYKYDGWNVTREMSDPEGTNATTVEYTYDSAGKPLSMRRNNATYYYTYNARGDVTALVDSNGAVTNSYSYNPWGKHLTESENVTNPYRYASYRYDSETGLYYLQNRYYSPDLMRFITRDLIKDQIGEPDTSNYYLYAGGNPINYVDPDGYRRKSYRLRCPGIWTCWLLNFLPGCPSCYPRRNMCKSCNKGWRMWFTACW